MAHGSFVTFYASISWFLDPSSLAELTRVTAVCNIAWTHVPRPTLLVFLSLGSIPGTSCCTVQISNNRGAKR